MNEKYIQKSTNMPGIGSLILEIDVKKDIYLGKQRDFNSVKSIPAS